MEHDESTFSALFFPLFTSTIASKLLNTIILYVVEILFFAHVVDE
jgi:hypothetical protein